MSTSFVREKLGEEGGIAKWRRVCLKSSYIELATNSVNQTQFTLDVCWALSVAVVQLFLLQFYTRLYSDCRRLLYLCYTMMVFVAGWFIYAIAKWAIHCPSLGNCSLPTTKTCTIIGAIHILYNLIVMGMAIPAVYSMHFFSRRKLSVAGLILLGIL
jgi:hypothetical protein